jgi:mannosidase alpha-like ER degradation enhancer 2
MTVNDAARLASRVKREFLHAWAGYCKHAWGHDDLRPLSRTSHDWHGTPLLITPVDALDTMVLMGLDAEATQTKDLILGTLSFDKDVFVSVFEVTIRLLGGLVSSYELLRDVGFLELAEDLGTRLLPAFESPTGIPYRSVNLRFGVPRDPETNPAEAGTLLLEFGTLSRLTGKQLFYEKAKRALEEVFRRRSELGLVGDRIHAETGEWLSFDCHVSAGIDSYFEYQLKAGLAFRDEDCRRMWEASLRGIHGYLADEVGTDLWYGHADMRDGRRTSTTFGALDAFFPAVLALSGDVDRAARLQTSCFKMWNLHDIEPERFDYRTNRIGNGAYPLRPEVAESCFYLYRITGDPRYREMGRTVFESLVRHCRVPSGYASLADVVTRRRSDEMHSFCLSETFKYLYLLFAPPDTVDFDRIIFTTEAHPLPRHA